MTHRGHADNLTDVQALMTSAGDIAALVVGGKFAAEFKRYTDDDDSGVVYWTEWVDLRVAPPSAFSASQVNIAEGAVTFVDGVGWRTSDARVELDFLAALGVGDPLDIQLVASVGGDTPVAADRLVWGLFRPDGLSDVDYGWTMIRRSSANTIWQQVYSSTPTSPTTASLASNHTGTPTNVQLHAKQFRYSAGNAVGLRGNVTGASAGNPNAGTSFVGAFSAEPEGIRAPFFQVLRDSGSNIHFDIHGILCQGKTRLEGL